MNMKGVNMKLTNLKQSVQLTSKGFSCVVDTNDGEYKITLLKEGQIICEVVMDYHGAFAFEEIVSKAFYVISKFDGNREVLQNEKHN